MSFFASRYLQSFINIIKENKHDFYKKGILHIIIGFDTNTFYINICVIPQLNQITDINNNKNILWPIDLFSNMDVNDIEKDAINYIKL